ncbi:MAG: hypothetical protein OXC37_05955 [Bdellovibrionaceae bacterium]|nr:hypothetical protein [Pseudobdellovibrionaceae bacterium]
MKLNGFIKAGSLLIMLFSFTFSLSSFGAPGDLIHCRSTDNQKGYQRTKEYLQEFPNDMAMIYNLGVNAFCIGKKEEGIQHIKNASNGGHILASRIIARYYYTDKTLDRSVEMTTDPHHFNQMLGYIERAADLIEAARYYPEGTTDDMPEIEEKNRLSAKIFIALPNTYYKGYVAAIVDIISGEGNISYIDTKEVLIRMRDSSERCLRRPSLSVWKGDRETIAYSLQLRCQAMWYFADEALILEEKRISAERDCASTPIKECSEHQNIVNQLVDLSHIMQKQLDSAPPIRYGH